MAYEENLSTISLEAAADLSAKQYYFMKVDTNGRANVPSVEGEITAGVLQNDPAALGRAATIAVAGSVSKVVAGEAIAAGAQITAGSDGRAMNSDSGDDTRGINLTIAATAAGDIISVLLV